jgi:iron complex transport system substrate-binding protein
LPSATEIVCALGLADEIVAITHECDYPPEIRERPVVVHPLVDASFQTSREIDARVEAAVGRGESLYRIDLDALRAARPDVLITQDLCDVCALPSMDVDLVLGALPGSPTVLRLHPHTLADILNNIRTVGAATGREREAQRLVAHLEERIARVEEAVRGRERHRVFCMEWLDPPFCGGHWMPELVERAGGREVLGRPGRPSVRVDWSDIARAAPQVVVLTVCGFDVPRTQKEAHAIVSRPEWLGLPAVQAGRVYATDASSFFSRSGPRIVGGLEILGAILHPDAVTWRTPSGSWAVLDQDVPSVRRGCG